MGPGETKEARRQDRDDTVSVLRAAVRPLTGAATDYDPLIERIGDARFVLLGEASHGTREFYRTRARITQRLIAEKGFTGVAVEADWPDAYRVNRYASSVGDDVDAAQALAGFRRFPRWMWRNTEVQAFVEWLRTHNAELTPGARKAGFYGLDLYSLHSSMEAVLGYLEQVDPAAARRARSRYACFDHFGPDPQVYGFIAGNDVEQSCREQVLAQLVELQQRPTPRDGKLVEDEMFHAEQNARLVKNAEAYYRAMFFGDVPSWNLRDQHMAETLDALVGHLGRHGEPAKLVVWAHNSHLGDAAATEMSERGELNLGQLAREKYGRAAVLVGFTTHHGRVTAASEWGGPTERKAVRPALAGSWEALFHSLPDPDFMLAWHPGDVVGKALREPRLERAIGVIYRPATERVSHYFSARLADQFDAVLHFDETHAVEPLDYGAEWQLGELPETYPFGV